MQAMNSGTFKEEVDWPKTRTSEVFRIIQLHLEPDPDSRHSLRSCLVEQWVEVQGVFDF